MAMARSMTDQIAREMGLGFLYWLAFLLVLEPGNLLRAANAGRELPLDREALRIFVASLLGSTSAPILMMLVRRFPIEGAVRRRNAVIHALGGVGMSFLLIAASVLLAAVFLADRRSLPDALRDNLLANGLLLIFSIAGFVAIAHAVRFRRRLESAIPAPPAWLSRIPVSSRGRTLLLDIGEVDWIEAQGNYLALHVGGETHLVRDTVTALLARLDPDRFVRIHRGAIVAIDRIAAVTPVGGGDAVIGLKGGAELRLSRSFRTHLAAALSPPST